MDYAVKPKPKRPRLEPVDDIDEFVELEEDLAKLVREEDEPPPSSSGSSSESSSSSDSSSSSTSSSSSGANKKKKEKQKIIFGHRGWFISKYFVKGVHVGWGATCKDNFCSLVT